MYVGTSLAMIDVATKFFRSVYLRGLFRDEIGKLASVEIPTPAIVAAHSAVGVQHLAPPGEDPAISRWEIQLMMTEPVFPETAVARFTTDNGAVHDFAIADLIYEREITNASKLLSNMFFDELDQPDMRRVLNLGGRDRSKAGLSLFKDQHEVTVFDIIDEPGVDVVGDAHELSRHFPPNHFDAVMCISVLEHIAMPWKVAIEVAKVVRPGGLCLFQTHQTVGMHDLPWDFWRYSESAWDALFNADTGFKVEHRAMAHETFIIPFRWRPGIAFESAAGFESSAVLVRKIGEPKVEWPVDLRRIMSTMYPTE